MSAGEWAINLIMAPGSSVQLLPVINLALAIVIGVMGYTAYSTDNGAVQLHCSVMSFLALGLCVVINWFVGEYQKAKAEQEAAGDSGAEPEPASGASRRKID
eukprot:CAMPEP_0118863404 /NCGR_PEP_ID=MMETSP1163-20130328/8293_1 /TAXON_ID=124430 /ORGANISM="Phaeomonas parva, Strain CCMP2877" /LENGTH=101 /DNA_ID=CAMNT_0006797409 /DNA_START=19 /DNA_END=324 /DNA_ORIENTATION=+